MKVKQIMPAPAPLADADGNLYVGYALIEIDRELSTRSRNTTPNTVQDILPFGADGGLIGLPGDIAYYEAHGLGPDGYPIEPLSTT